MNKLFAPLSKLIASITAPKADKTKPAPPALCSFCGEKGHTADDCPKAAKYQLFHVDRE